MSSKYSPDALIHRLPWVTKRIPVVRLSGLIAHREGAIHLDRFAPVLDRGFAMAEATEGTLILAIDSPGGSPVQSDLIGRYLRRKAGRTEVTLLAVIGDVGASGGYWIACAADTIIANPMSVVGSIGVVGGGFGVPDLIRRLGIERRIVTAGEHKLRNDPFSPRRKEDEEFTRALLDDIHVAFKDWVRERRGNRIAGNEAAIFDGSYMLGDRAKALGLIDSFGDVRSVIAERFGDEAEPLFLQPRKPFTALRLLGGGAGAGLGATLLDTIERELAGLSLR